MDEQQLNAALTGRVLTHQGVTYGFTGARVRTTPITPNAVDVEFAAARVDGTGEPIRGELHLSLTSFNDREFLLEAIDHTVTAILDGRLPPGTRELL